MKICLHIGAHRTGTTAFQTLLQGQRRRLDAAQLAFWGPKRTRSGLFAGLVKNPNLLNAKDMASGRRSCGRIAMELQRLQHEGMRTLIVSEENMIGTMVENLASAQLYGQAAPRLARFGTAFAGHRPQIWVGMRSYDTLWASQWAFRIKVGAAVPRQPEVDRLFGQTRRWPDVIAGILHAIPDARITVWRFEDWVRRPSMLLDALLREPIGLHDSASAPSNASMSGPDLANLAHDRGDADGAAQILAHSENGCYMPFTASQQAVLQERYSDDLLRLLADGDGVATYLDPTEGTFGGRDMTRGSHHERQEASVAGPR